MSELIDRIADLDKISGEVKEVLTLIGQINTAITDVKDTVKNGVLGGARTAKDFDDLKVGAKSLNDEFAKGDVLMKRWEVEVANLKEKTKQLLTEGLLDNCSSIFNHEFQRKNPYTANITLTSQKKSYQINLKNTQCTF